MKERNYRKGLKPLKKLPLYWLWMPIIHSLLLLFGYDILKYSLPDDWGSVLIGLIFLHFYTFVLTPTMSILYCKRIDKMGWIKYLCCIYNAFMIGIYQVIGAMFGMGAFRTPSNLISTIKLLTDYLCLSVFIPALICGLITLIVYDVTKIVYGAKKRNTDHVSLSK